MRSFRQVGPTGDELMSIRACSSNISLKYSDKPSDLDLEHQISSMPTVKFKYPYTINELNLIIPIPTTLYQNYLRPLYGA